MKPIAELLRAYLALPGTSQAELARLSGIPLTTINRYAQPGAEALDCTTKTYAALAQVIEPALVFGKEEA